MPASLFPLLLAVHVALAAAEDPVRRVRARRQRYVSYAMAGLVGTIAFLMSTKPRLW